MGFLHHKQISFFALFFILIQSANITTLALPNSSECAKYLLQIKPRLHAFIAIHSPQLRAFRIFQQPHSSFQQVQELPHDPPLWHIRIAHLNTAPVVMKFSDKNSILYEASLLRFLNRVGIGTRFVAITRPLPLIDFDADQDLGLVTAFQDGVLIKNPDIFHLDPMYVQNLATKLSHEKVLYNEATITQIMMTVDTLTQHGLLVFDLQFLLDSRGKATLLDVAYFRIEPLYRPFTYIHQHNQKAAQRIIDLYRAAMALSSPQ